MTKSNREKTWSELSPPEVDHYFRVCAERANTLADWAKSTWMEFAKYLFAVNAGAAAGLFLLAKSDTHLLMTSFSLFCGGVFSVGIAFFAMSSYAYGLVEGWTTDFNSLMRNEITFAELDARHLNRYQSRKLKIGRTGLAISFFLLISGGIVTAKAIWFR